MATITPPLVPRIVSGVWITLDLAFFVAMLPLLLWRKRYQPLKSRGIVPFFSLLILTVASLLQLADDLLGTFDIDMPCFLFLYQLRVGTYILFPYTLQAFRVFCMIKLQKRATENHRQFMQNVALAKIGVESLATEAPDTPNTPRTPASLDSDTKSSASEQIGHVKFQKATRLLTILKAVTSWRLLLPLGACIMLLDAAVVPLFTIAPPYRTLGACQLDKWALLYFPTLVIPLFMIEFSLIFWSIALFWVKEKLAMREEIIAITAVYFLMIVSFFLMLLLSTSEIATRIFLYLIIFGFALLRVIVVLIPTILTFVWEARSKMNSGKQMKKSNVPAYESDVVWEMLRDDELRRVFRRYAEQELSHENVLFFEAILRFQATKHKKNRQELAEYIYNEFIREDAILELNINRARRKAVAARLNIVWEEQQADEDETSKSNSPLPQESQSNSGNDNCSNNGSALSPLANPNLNPISVISSSSSSLSAGAAASLKNERAKRDLPDNIFEDVVKDVKSLMHDTFARFTRSTMYHQFVKETEMRHNILANANII